MISATPRRQEDTRPASAGRRSQSDMYADGLASKSPNSRSSIVEVPAHLSAGVGAGGVVAKVVKVRSPMPTPNRGPSSPRSRHSTSGRGTRVTTVC
jgi:hypothetical protein